MKRKVLVPRVGAHAAALQREIDYAVLRKDDRREGKTLADYCRILIIDDEFIMRQGMKHMMDWEKEGFQIVGEASNGQEGLKLVETLSPNIVLCDIVMPVMDGLDFSQAVTKLFPEVQIIILSSYDKFEYVKNAMQKGAVDYILKPTLNPEELLKVLRKAVKRIPGLSLKQKEGICPEKFLERYLLGEYESLAGPKIVEHFPYTFYRVFGMQITARVGEKRGELSSLLYEKAMAKMEQCACCKWMSAVLREEVLCFVLNFRAGDREEIVRYMEELTQELSCFWNGTMGVLSDEFSTRSMVKETFDHEVLPQIDQRFYYKGIRLVVGKGEKKPPVPRFDFNRFSVDIVEKRFIEALDLLEKYVGEALKGRLEEIKLKNQLKNMLFNLLDEIDLEREKRMQLQYELLKEIDGTLYQEEFCSVMEGVDNRIRKILVSNSEMNNPHIGRILQYIGDHYNQDLKLASIAEKFGFNYFYLSTYFKRHMEEGFSGYLNRVRVEQACRLLREQSCSIAEVSSQIGYSDPSYFCRVFKQITGDTPSSWRRRCKKMRREDGDET